MASTPQPSQAELVASNARLWAGGGCIFADASNAGTSAAVIPHQVSMHRNITRLGSPDNHELRARRAMVLRLSYWRVLRRPEASRPSLAPVRSTGARTGRSGAFKLANAASRIRGQLFGVDVCYWPQQT